MLWAEPKPPQSIGEFLLPREPRRNGGGGESPWHWRCQIHKNVWRLHHYRNDESKTPARCSRDSTVEKSKMTMIGTCEDARGKPLPAVTMIWTCEDARGKPLPAVTMIWTCEDARGKPLPAVAGAAPLRNPRWPWYELVKMLAALVADHTLYMVQSWGWRYRST